MDLSVWLAVVGPFIIILLTYVAAKADYSQRKKKNSDAVEVNEQGSDTDVEKPHGEGLCQAQ